MAEILFYHLGAAPLEKALPDLLERTLARGWAAVVRAGSEARLSAIDDLLWRYRDDAFLPHGTAAAGAAELQPVYLTTGAENPAGAGVLMLVEGARIDPGETGAYDRVCLIFNGNEPENLAAAREDWKAVKAAGLGGKYWAQEDGRWVEKAAG